jgi:branched-chain amino acid transport system ATP-binding protein
MKMLSARGLEAGYGHVKVLRGIDLEVNAGEVVVLLGANGAGKTTTLLSLAGAIPSEGEVRLHGRLAPRTLYERAKCGLAFLPEERGIIRALTVAENLRLARVPLTKALEISPELELLEDRPAGLLSGGEQQILALTRVIASNPAVLLADELSLGLAPMIVQRMLSLVRVAAKGGAAVLMVEQFARQALNVTGRAYVMQRGEIVLQGEAAELKRDFDAVERSYLGTGTGTRYGAG